MLRYLLPNKSKLSVKECDLVLTVSLSTGLTVFFFGAGFFLQWGKASQFSLAWSIGAALLLLSVWLLIFFPITVLERRDNAKWRESFLADLKEYRDKNSDL